MKSEGNGKIIKLYGDGKRGIFPASLGPASMGMSMVVLGMLTYYLTTQCGLSGTVVGTILLCSRIFDGISDLLVGYIIDRCHFKLGKARPFDLFNIPMWIFLVLCFAVPQLNTIGKIIYVFLMYNLCQTVCYTFVSVSGTIRLKRTFNDDKRANAVAVASVMTAVMATMAGIVLPLMIDNLEYQPNGWIIIALSFAVPGILMSLCNFVFVPEKEQNQGETVVGKIEFKDYVKVLFQNKYLITVIIVGMGGTLANAVLGAVGTFYFKYVFGNLAMSSLLGVFSLFGYLFMMAIPFITKKWGNRKAMLAAFGILFFSNVAKLVMPQNIIWLGTCGTLVLIGTAFCGSICSLIMIDMMHYGKLMTGKENDGVYSAIKGFSDKVANGVGPLLVGLVLDIGGFDGTLEVQSASANMAITALFTVIPAVIAAIGFFTMYVCKMEKDIKRMEAERVGNGI